MLVNCEGKVIWITAVLERGLVKVREKVKVVDCKMVVVVDATEEDVRILGEVVMAKEPVEISSPERLMVTVTSLESELMRVLTFRLLVMVNVVPLAITPLTELMV